MSATPILETPRLRLRAFTKADYPAFLAMQREPAVHRYFGPEPMGPEEVWRRLCAGVGNWVLNGFGPFAVFRRDDDRFVGNVGLFTAQRDFEPRFGDEPEMGWVMATETHGTGMAREACDAVLRWAEESLPPTPIWAIISEANEPSFALAAKLGFERVATIDYHGPTVVLRRPARG